MTCSRKPTSSDVGYIRTYHLTCLIIFLVLSPLSFAQEFNPKAVDTITLKITQSGELDVNGSVDHANLSLYIPQEGVQSINVFSNRDSKWDYATDRFGNKIVVIGWKNPAGVVTYSLETVVRNAAKSVNPAIGIGSDTQYLASTNSIVFTDNIRKAAYPYERTWENVARMAEFVYDYVDYDISLVGARHSSDWVYENKRGVCVEHANLLTAMLRSSGISTRYVVGYAYSSIDKELIGHTWVEVLAGDGTWIPFDPTWLEGGYLDATHIKTANLLDDNQTDVLRYFGNGKITWKRGDSSAVRRLRGDLYLDKVEILDYTSRNLTFIELYASDVTLNGYGYVKAAINSESCTINQISIAPCVNAQKNPIFDVFEKERVFYSCGKKDIYWFFREMDGQNAYECPVSVFDQIGSTQKISVKSIKDGHVSDVGISGPDTVAAGEWFILTASAPEDFIFYSPESGRNPDKTWNLMLEKTGTYNFYLYADNSLAVKDISVVDKKEFDLFVAAPDHVKRNQTFQIDITARNIGNTKYTKLRVELDGKIIENSLTFFPNEEKNILFNITAAGPGRQQLSVSLLSSSLTTYSSYIFVDDVKNEKSIIDNITGTFSSILSLISDAISNIFRAVSK